MVEKYPDYIFIFQAVIMQSNDMQTHTVIKKHKTQGASEIVKWIEHRFNLQKEGASSQDQFLASTFVNLSKL